MVAGKVEWCSVFIIEMFFIQFSCLSYNAASLTSFIQKICNADGEKASFAEL